MKLGELERVLPLRSPCPAQWLCKCIEILFHVKALCVLIVHGHGESRCEPSRGALFACTFRRVFVSDHAIILLSTCDYVMPSTIQLTSLMERYSWIREDMENKDWRVKKKLMHRATVVRNVLLYKRGLLVVVNDNTVENKVDGKPSYRGK